MPTDTEQALAWVHAGCSVIPIRTDGSKGPIGAWKHAQAARAATGDVESWIAAGHGIGVVCGAVSGNLEMLELEGAAVTEGYGSRLRDALADHGRADLLAALVTGCLTQSPSGGYHLWYRVEGGPARRNTKLARRPVPGGARVQVLIETRGEGGYAVVPPSAGTVHPTGRPWTRVAGGPGTIPTITVDDRDALHAIATLLDEMPCDAIETDAPATASITPLTPGGKRPGDAFNETATWDEILAPHGWVKAGRSGKGWAWRRPGKDDAGISATTGQREDADRLWVFTTSTTLPDSQPLSKLWVWAHYEHGGDLGAAVKALAERGYGDPLPPRERLRSVTFTGGVEGALATVHQLHPDGDSDTATTLDLTDDANALRLVEAHGGVIRRVSDMGQWHAWDGVRWRRDADDAAVRELARGIARDLADADKDERAWKKASLSATGISSCIRVASSDPRIAIRAERLDAHPLLLNTPDGVLDLATGTLRPHDPALLLTRTTATGVHLGAPHPRWTGFLEETFGGDADLIDYLRRLAGLALIGEVREHILPLWYGAGANGKGVTLLVWQLLLGAADTGGYAQSAPDGFLMVGQGQGHPTDIARLRGARLLVASEQTSGKRFDEAKVKRLTGGDTLTGRFMRGDFFDFTPTHLVVVATNHLPSVPEGGPSFWRRARLIPFEHVVPEERRDPELHNRLVAEEGPAILGWMASGAMDVITQGMRTPARVLAATDDYRVSEDTLASFVRDECITGPHYWVKTSDFYHRYEAYCREMGSDPLSQTAIGRRLTAEFGTTAARHSQLKVRIHRGIGIETGQEGGE